MLDMHTTPVGRASTVRVERPTGVEMFLAELFKPYLGETVVRGVKVA